MSYSEDDLMAEISGLGVSEKDELFRRALSDEPMEPDEALRYQELVAQQAQLQRDLKMLLDELDRAKSTRRIDEYRPYSKQLEFHNLGATKTERLLIAGNRLGKTEAGAHEASYHLTGDYPKWWRGRKFTQPIVMWAAGESGNSTRDVIQQKMFGEPGVVDAQGTGTVPKDAIVHFTLMRGVANAYDSVQVRHASGGVSIVYFKSYEQGRAKWQGTNLDLVWFDEEPPQPIYLEGITRLITKRGLSIMTFTPLKGTTKVVDRFLTEDEPERAHVTMTMADVSHISEEDKEAWLRKWPEHEREARANGVPMLGSGRIFPYADSVVLCDPFDVPRYWARIVGIDIGADHPTGLCDLAWDRDNDVIYMVSEYRKSTSDIPSGFSPMPEHANWVKQRHPELPVAWPKDAHEREKSSGEEIAKLYKKQGLKMLSKHAQFESGSVSVEAGIMEMQDRMTSGRFKVFRTCSLFMEEFRQYHRKEGQIIKLKDDLISAVRYAIMMKRYAAVLPDKLTKRRRQTVARDVDYSVFG